MESIDDYQKRKEERIEKLFGSSKKQSQINRLAKPKVFGFVNVFVDLQIFRSNIRIQKYSFGCFNKLRVILAIANNFSVCMQNILYFFFCLFLIFSIIFQKFRPLTK